MIAKLFKWLPTGISQQLTKFYFRAITYNQKGPHSSTMSVELNSMAVKVIPALQDNYMYLLVDKATNETAVVDPVEPAAVLDAVQKEGLNLTTVLTTHHHWDHAGGNEELLQMCPHLKVYGGDTRIGAITNHVTHNNLIKLGSINIRCLFTPCHTTGHICYYAHNPMYKEDKVVFTGDTLFLGGCGRFFEGTAEQMHKALNITLSALTDDTLVFCGHEYTLQNLSFAAQVEPRNENIMQKLEWAQNTRSQGLPTVPGTIGEEKLINPFMRVYQQSVQTYAGKFGDPIATMKQIREAKDNFSM